ncbi:MAG: glycoside hydrolase family 3 protein, partial [Calditrichaeota bacterium]
IPVLFPFGHGLSYTTFSYSDLQVKGNSDHTVTVRVTVTNSGAMAGQEVVQVYVAAQKSKQPRPKKELKAFQKVNLSAGESKIITLTLEQSAFAYFHPKAHKWTVERGKYTVLVGGSSQDIRMKGEVNI